MSRSLNRATLIGNLTRDPELRYTPQGTAVCTFTVATNRQWKTETGDTKDDAEFHRVVAWDKLAEICSQLLGKGKRVFVEGRIQTRKWEDRDGNTKYTTEIVISDMLLLDRGGESQSDDDGSSSSAGAAPQSYDDDIEVPEDLDSSKDKENPPAGEDGDEDIPF